MPDHFTASVIRSAFLSTTAYSPRHIHPSIPLASLRQPHLYRPISTETQTTQRSEPPPPSGISGSTATSNQLPTRVPPPGSPPPAPPAPLNASPPKVAEQAEEKAEQAIAKKKEEKSGSLSTRVWSTVKKEAAHYWAGTKLLGQEIKISAKLQWKVLNGGTLTRRERRQVSTTVVSRV